MIASPAEAARWICERARDPDESGIDVHLLNAYSLALADKEVGYRSVLTQSAANFPDGRPIAVLTRFSRTRLRQVRGPQLFNDVMDIGRDVELRHFLLGSTDAVLRALRTELEERYPGVKIVGILSPPFRPLDAEEIVNQDLQIRESGAQIVWVGLGTPKQDWEAQRHARASGILSVAVGAAFDFVAGTIREAPPWASKLGVEWIFRLMSEPRRLWRRYLFGNARFLRSAVVRALERNDEAPR